MTNRDWYDPTADKGYRYQPSDKYKVVAWIIIWSLILLSINKVDSFDKCNFIMNKKLIHVID